MNPHALFNSLLLREYDTLTCTDFLCTLGNISELNNQVYRCESNTIRLLEPIISLKQKTKIMELNYQLNKPHQYVKFNIIFSRVMFEVNMYSPGRNMFECVYMKESNIPPLKLPPRSIASFLYCASLRASEYSAWYNMSLFDGLARAVRKHKLGRGCWDLDLASSFVEFRLAVS